jgi:hypothetical protein
VSELQEIVAMARLKLGLFDADGAADVVDGGPRGAGSCTSAVPKLPHLVQHPGPGEGSNTEAVTTLKSMPLKISTLNKLIGRAPTLSLLPGPAGVASNKVKATKRKKSSKKLSVPAEEPAGLEANVVRDNVGGSVDQMLTRNVGSSASNATAEVFTHDDGGKDDFNYTEEFEIERTVEDFVDTANDESDDADYVADFDEDIGDDSISVNEKYMPTFESYVPYLDTELRDDNNNNVGEEELSGMSCNFETMFGEVDEYVNQMNKQRSTKAGKVRVVTSTLDKYELKLKKEAADLRQSLLSKLSSLDDL